MSRARVLLPNVVEAFISPLTQSALRSKANAFEGRQVPGRWGVRMNHYTTDLYIVVYMGENAKGRKLYIKRRVHAWARFHRDNRQYFIKAKNRNMFLDHGYFEFIRSIATPALKALTHD